MLGGFRVKASKAFVASAFTVLEPSHHVRKPELATWGSWKESEVLGLRSQPTARSVAVTPSQSRANRPASLKGNVRSASMVLFSPCVLTDSLRPHGRQHARLPSATGCSSCCTVVLISRASKVLLRILQARFQQYLNRELPDVQAGFGKGRGTGDLPACCGAEGSRSSWVLPKCPPTES